jgi:hypothetical protein
MNDLGNQEKFKEDFNSFTPVRYIRKEVLENNKKRKVVAFWVSGLDYSIKRGESFYENSEKILEREKNNFDEKIVLYKWTGSDFHKIEDIKNQNWFKI